MTRSAAIVNLLNQIILATGCDKATAILIACKGFIDQGLPARQALDLVCGKGATDAVAAATWKALQPA